MAIKGLDSYSLADSTNAWQSLVDHGITEELCQLIINIASWKDVVRACVLLKLAIHIPDSAQEARSEVWLVILCVLFESARSTASAATARKFKTSREQHFVTVIKEQWSPIMNTVCPFHIIRPKHPAAEIPRSDKGDRCGIITMTNNTTA